MSNRIRLAHFSDTHLGYRAAGKADPVSGRNQRTVDVDQAFMDTIDHIIEQKVDGVIHSGDVFHHARPTWQSLRHFIRQMRKLEHAKIPTLVIAGNHDTPRVRTGGSAYSVLELALPDITFVTEYEDKHDTTTFGHLDLHIHAVPHGALTNPDPVLSQTVQGKRNILVTHGTAPGVMPAGLRTEPGEQDLDAILLDPAFDYIALGHIHQHQQATANAWYAGSTERFGWGDVTAEPGYNIVEMSEPGAPVAVQHMSVPTRPMIPLKPVYGGGKAARDIADAVIDQLARLESPTAMTRVDLRETARPLRRETQSLLKRETDTYVWLLDIAPERMTFLTDTGAPVFEDTSFDLHELFREFVAMRKGLYPSPEFATMMLERGSKALTEAMLAEENPTPEEDALS